MDKTEIRKIALRKRQALSAEEQTSLSRKIIGNLEAFERFREAKAVLLYYSHQSEVRTHDFIQKWLNHKELLLPRLSEGNTFVALPFFSLDELKKNRFGIPEPPMTRCQEPPTVPDLIIVPGVAFDRKGNRIGMGMGYYDRFLEGMETIPKIGLAYSQQILDALPKDPYDIPINFLITENEVIRCQS